jgi:hypothetical protein
MTALLTGFDKLQRQRARSRVRQALQKGALVKGSCRYAVTGDCSGVLEAHHYLGYDDAHWLDVQWCCHRHHGRLHRGPKPQVRVQPTCT